MKPLSLIHVAMATMIFILCTSFNTGKESSFRKGVPAVHRFDVEYYWYYANDTYDGYYTTSQVIAQMEDSLGVLVNTSSYNSAVLVASAYYDNNYPHDEWPVVYLYAHY